MVNAFFMLTMLLPGTAGTYQGEEIGQPDPTKRSLSGHKGFRNLTALVKRGPFLWDDSRQAGFTSSINPWLPIDSSYRKINLETQKNASKSHYKIYKQIIDLRKTNTIQRGSLQLYKISKWVLAFTRKLPGNNTHVVVLNIGSQKENITLADHIKNLPSTLNVEVSSINSEYEDGEKIDTSSSEHNPNVLKLRPKASIVLTTASIQKSSHENSTNTTADSDLPVKPKTPIIMSTASNQKSSHINLTDNTDTGKSSVSAVSSNRLHTIVLMLAPIAAFFFLFA